MNSRKAIIAVAAVAAVAVASYYLVKPKANKDSVTIAMNLALTGPVAAASGEYPLAFQMGVDDSCSRLNIAPTSVIVKAGDNMGTPKDAVSVFKQQEIAGFDAYISGLSYASSAIAPELDDDANSPHFMLAFDAFITEKGMNRIRLLPSYRIQGPKYVEYANQIGAKRLFIMTSDNSYVGEQFSSFVEPRLIEMGIEYGKESFDLATMDFRTLALKAKAFSPDLVIIDCLSFQMLPLLQSLRSNGLGEDAGTLLCSMDYIFLLSATNDVPEDIRGVAFIAPAFELPGESPDAEEWRKRFREKGGKDPNFIQAYAYDTAQLLIECQSRFGNVAPESILKTVPFAGLTGEINFDKNRDLIADLKFMAIDYNGRRCRVSFAKPIKDGSVGEVELLQPAGK